MISSSLYKSVNEIEKVLQAIQRTLGIIYCLNVERRQDDRRVYFLHSVAKIIDQPI